MSDTSPSTRTGTEASEIAAAVTGPGTPDNVTVKRPARQVLAAVFVALGLVLIGVGAVIFVVSYGPFWPAADAVAIARINALKWIGWLLCGDVVLLVGSIALPGGLGKVEASAGTNSIKIEGRP